MAQCATTKYHQTANPTLMTRMRYDVAGPTMEAQYRPTRQVLEFTRQCQSLWRVAHRNDGPPLVVKLEDDEKDLSRLVRSLEKPDYDFFNLIDPPGIVTKLTASEPQSTGLGRSDLLPQGLVEKQ